MVRFSRFLTLLLIISLPMFAGCEGEQGPVGPEGPEGPEGPIGPAGEDGSMLYSGSGEPDASTGNIGDYYLDSDTGEMYGPKDDTGWGNPIIVLKGEDGNQIHAGSGTPDASLGDLGDFYLDQANYDMYGPKTDNGWGTPVNLKGADGNANVTRYIYPGHDFGSQSSLTLTVPGISNTEFRNSDWSVYLANDRGVTNSTFRYYPIPGDGVYATYSVSFGNINDTYAAFFIESSGAATEYERLEIIRIEASNIEDQTKQKAREIIPSGLDTSDYEEVAEYYGFYR